MATMNKPTTQISYFLPTRLLLTDVPGVGFYSGGQRCPENVPFPACLRACLDFAGRGMGSQLISTHDTTWRLDNTYTYLMGVSGCAFRLSWKPGWYGDNVEIMYMSDDPAAPFLRAFQAAGYAPDMLLNMERAWADDTAGAEEYLRKAVVRSLADKGMPVIAFGIIGPPEACLITGYDEDGRVVMGWNYFQDFPEYNAGVEFEPGGQFRVRDWFAKQQGLVFFGSPLPAIPQEEIFREAVRWALQVMRTPVTFGDRHNGIAAYQAWADHLLLDSEFCGDMAALRERFLVHDDAVSVVAEGRWYGARFLELMAGAETMTRPGSQVIPACEEALRSAAACFDAEHDLMWQIWGCVGSNGRSDENVRKLADPLVRRSIVPLILQARDLDARAAEYMEQALALW